MRLIDADALQAEIDDPTVIRPEGFNILDAAPTVECEECWHYAGKYGHVNDACEDCFCACNFQRRQP